MFKRFTTLLNLRKKLTILAAGNVLVGIGQGVALILLVPVLRAIFHGDYHTAFTWTWWFLGVAAVTATLNVVLTVYGFDLSTFDICGNVVRRIGEKVMRLPVGWFDKGASSRVSHALTFQNDNLSHYSAMAIPRLYGTGAMATVLMVAGLIVNWQATLPLVIAIPFGIKALKLLEDDGVKAMAVTDKTGEELTRRSLEYAQAQHVLRASNMTDWEPLTDAIEEDSTAVEAELKAESRGIMMFQQPLFILLGISLLVCGYQLVNGTLDLALFVPYALVLLRLAFPLAGLIMERTGMRVSEEALDGIGSILNADVLPEPDVSQTPANSAITFEDVTFGYTPETPVLQDITLEMPANTITALVGPSGGGKSTVQRLISRFWDVDSGAVRIGGVDVRDMTTDELMEKISIVFQKTYLFDSDILDNVRVGRADATDEEVIVAAKAASLDKVVENLPDGWHTNVGEGGSRLSGGERQRVAIARALLKRAPILLLDEVTSSLDGENEAAIVDTLHKLAPTTTVVVIAHRLSTIRGADQIAVINEGRVEQVGTHAELSAQPGTYQEFWEDQEYSERWKLVTQ